MLEAHELTKTYRLGKVSVQALAGVSFQVNKGHILCITGRSGSGKSTLLRQLGLLDTPTSGRITLEGRDVTRISSKARAQLRLAYLGYVFQEYALLQELTAHENVYLPGLMLGARSTNCRRRARELLEVVGLSQRWMHRPKELSGGEQQRVAIARALINSPQVLFADEPCANLDSESSRIIMDTLVRLNHDMGLTIIFVSHDPDDVRYATDWLTLSDGKITGRKDMRGGVGTV